MFGSDLDFFGVYAKRRRMSLDLDKRKKIADTQAHLRMMGRDQDLNKIFLSKGVLFRKITSKRQMVYVEEGASAFELLEGRPEREDPVVAAALTMVSCDRLDDLPRVLRTLNRQQIRQVEAALADYKIRIADEAQDEESAGSTATDTPDTEGTPTGETSEGEPTEEPAT